MEQQEQQKQEIIKRALLVEDYVPCQKIMTHYLDQLGYQVDLVDGSLAAIQTIQAKTYNLIIQDINLHGAISGKEIIQKIRNSKLNAGTPLIVWTAYANKNDEEKYLAWGADGVLIKACQIKTVKKAIEKCLLTSRHKRNFHFKLKGLIEKWKHFLNEARELKETQFTRDLEFLHEATIILKKHHQRLGFQKNEE